MGPLAAAYVGEGLGIVALGLADGAAEGGAEAAGDAEAAGEALTVGETVGVGDRSGDGDAVTSVVPAVGVD